jgi:hypothetical protein
MLIRHARRLLSRSVAGLAAPRRPDESSFVSEKRRRHRDRRDPVHSVCGAYHCRPGSQARPSSRRDRRVWPLFPTLDRTAGLPLQLLPEEFSYMSFGWRGELLDNANPYQGLRRYGRILPLVEHGVRPGSESRVRRRPFGAASCATAAAAPRPSSSTRAGLATARMAGGCSTGDGLLRREERD